MEEISIENHSCSHCQEVIGKEQKFCNHCGYPELGSDKEKSKFHADRIMNTSKTRDAGKLIRQARNTLFVIAGLTFLLSLITYFNQKDVATFIVNMIMTVIYILLGFWSQKKPLVSLVLALLIYLTIIVLNALFDPATIVQGIIMKIIVIAFLAKGINSALHLRNHN